MLVTGVGEVQQQFISPEYEYFLLNIWYPILYVIHISPVVLLVILNVIILVKLGMTRKARSQMTGNQESDSGSNKITKMLVTNCVVFACLSMPEAVMTMFLIFNGGFGGLSPYTESVMYFLDSIAMSLKFMNHSINLILYCITGKAFRSEILEIVRTISSKCGNTNQVNNWSCCIVWLGYNFSKLDSEVYIRINI